MTRPTARSIVRSLAPSTRAAALKLLMGLAWLALTPNLASADIVPSPDPVVPGPDKAAVLLLVLGVWALGLTAFLAVRYRNKGQKNAS